MLYITRKKNESIVINNDITITVVEVQGNKVKLGCVFPKDATIIRSELHMKVMEMNQEAANNYDDIAILSQYICAKEKEE